MTRALYGIRLAALGFHHGQDELLIAIGDQALTVSIVAEQLFVRPSTVSKMLGRLTERGLCEMSYDPRDARKTLVQITPAGVEVRNRVLRLRDEVEAGLSWHIDATSRRAMTQALIECAASLATQLRRMR